MPQTRAMELPPRARRIRSRSARFIFSNGTTSACAENTWHGSSRCRLRRNYLRVRGEYPRQTLNPPRTAELPPRARRIPSNSASAIESSGTTSACAENTKPPTSYEWLDRNYLRVRGEYLF